MTRPNGLLSAYARYLHRTKWLWLGALALVVVWALAVADGGGAAADGFAYVLS